MCRNITGKNALTAFIAVVYMISMVVTFSSDTMLPKIASMVIIPIAFFVFLVNPDFDRAKKLSEFPLWVIFGIAMMYALSIFIWLMNIEEADYVETGSSRVLFYIVNVLVAFCAVYVFGSKAVDYTLYSAFIMNGVIVLQGVSEYGLAQSFNDIINAIQTGEQDGFMHTTEINDITFVYGFFIAYYMFAKNYTKKSRAAHIVGCVFFLFIGFKRINMASTLLAVVLGIIFFILPEKFKKKYVFLIGAGVAIVSFLYIPIIRFGIFEYVMNKLEIETNTRIDLYNFIKSEYDFKLTFLGHGIDYVVEYLRYLKTQHVYYKGASLKYIHNDILVKYIELGFWGFCGWLYTMCIWFTKWINKKCGVAIAALYAVMTVNNFINFSTGNTNHSYSVRLVIEIIIFSCICKVLIEDKQEERLESVK